MQIADPTAATADAALAAAEARSTADTDADDLIYQLDASRDYDPLPGLERITAPLTWVNSGDDFINPPELGIAEKMVTRMPDARFILIPISEATRGHGTHTQAAVWKDYLIEFLRKTEQK